MARAETAEQRLAQLIGEVRRRAGDQLADELVRTLQGWASQSLSARRWLGQIGERSASESEPPPELLSSGEAATLLGVRSVNTVKRWAREGLLEGYQVGGRVKVTRRSAEAFRDHPVSTGERQVERTLEAVMAPFDVSEAEAAEITEELRAGRASVSQHDVAAGPS